MDAKGLIVDALSKNTGLSLDEVSKLLTAPPSSDLGDFAFPCFVLSKSLKKSPVDIAVLLTTKISADFSTLKHFEEIRASGPYVNFFMNKKAITAEVLKEVLKQKSNYGKSNEKEKVLIEFPSPNTNKPLHLGHMRNMSIGESVSRILEFNGKKVVRVNLNNDRGVHICKSMLAYERWGEGDTPQKSNMKSDHFVGKYYVLFSQKAKDDPKLEEEAQVILQKWESKDKKVIVLWKQMNKWALDGFKETYKLFNVKHDKNYFESKIYDDGKDLVVKGFNEGKFTKDDNGGIIVDLEKEGLGKKVLLRGDGTSIYITQDIALAKMKYDEFKPNRSLIVVASEQNHHFKVLAQVCKILGIKSPINHLSYGMVYLPEGRMKSREGTVVDADDFINEVRTLVKGEIKSRYAELKDKEIDSRSLSIAMSAIKYHLLKVGVERDMTYNPKESISFEGNTGPYLQYSYARACSILKKSKKKVGKYKVVSVEKKEYELVKKLGEFSSVVTEASKRLDSSVIASYNYDLAKAFNDFYQECPVIGSGDKEDFRLALVQSFRTVMNNALWLLGIEAISEM
ncbi:MAG: arginine--tRNA ligase [Nanoarchaeota archaeon]